MARQNRDDELSYFLVELPIHPDWRDEVQDKVQVEVQVNRGDSAYGVQDKVQVERPGARVEGVILSYCYRPQKRRDILSRIGLLSNQSNYKRHIYPLIRLGYLALTVPEKPNSKNQQYKTTPTGQAYLLSIEGGVMTKQKIALVCDWLTGVGGVWLVGWLMSRLIC